MLLCIVDNEFLEQKVNLPLFIARRIAQPSEENRPGVMVRIATFAVALSLAVMLLSMAVILGFKEEISRRVVGFSADIELSDIRSQRAMQSHPIQASDSLLALIRAESGIVACTPYAAREGIIRTQAGMQGIRLKGVGSDFDMRFFAELLTQGALPRVGDSLRHKELLLSEQTARKLRLQTGDKAELLFIEADGRPRRDRFKIAGLYHSGMKEMDNYLVITDLRNVRRLNGWSENEISGYEIRLQSTDSATEVSNRLNRALLYAEWEGAANLYAHSIQHRYPAIFDWLRTHNVNAAVILGIMLIVALFNMTSALLILVLERTRMIGMLKALGMTDLSLQQLFLYRALFIILKGMAWGNVAALGLCLAQKWGGVIKLNATGYLLSEVPIALNWGWWLTINFGAILLILLLLTLPTLIVSRIQPDQTIRYE